MRICDVQPNSSGRIVHRKFINEDVAPSRLHPGALVSLRDSHGSLLVGKRDGRGSQWELRPQTDTIKSSNLPPESLFVVLRRGDHIGFQCLGAGGRLVQAVEDDDAFHSLAEGFGNREAWEPADKLGDRLTNVHYRQRALGARVVPVTALPTHQLAAWEEELQVLAKEALARVDRDSAAAVTSEKRANELIRAGKRMYDQAQRESDELRTRLELANSLALKWQEEAALATEALESVRLELDRERATAGRQSSPSTVTVAVLQSQLENLQLSYERRTRELQESVTAQIKQPLRGRDSMSCPSDPNQRHECQAVEAAVAAVRAEAAAAMTALEESYAAEIEVLLHDRARLDSALIRIKDMTRNLTSFDPDNSTSTEQQRSLDNEDTEPALGVPIDPFPLISPSGIRPWSGSSFSLAPRPVSGSSSGYRSYRTVGGTYSGPEEEPLSETEDIGPAIEAIPAIMQVEREEEFHVALPLYAGPPQSTTNSAKSIVAMESEVYRFTQDANDMGTENEFVSPRASLSPGSHGGGQPHGGWPHCRSPEELNRIALAGGACCLIDYNGERPDAMTEAALERILDAPRQSIYDTTSMEPSRFRTWRAASISAPNSATKSHPPHGEISNDGDGVELPWPRGSLSLPGSGSSTPIGTGLGDFYHAEATDGHKTYVLGQALLAPSEVVARLECSSPDTANFVAQYMADHIPIRASAPALTLNKKNGKKEPAVNSGMKKVDALRCSAPAAMNATKRRAASFLQRPPVADDMLYGF